MTTGQLSHEAERQLARQLFNRAWELIDSQDRTAEQDRMMLVTACAAFLHWDAVGTEENRAIADWQISHVASLLGYGDLALTHAASALSRVRSAGLPAWLHASALEGLARAHAAAGNQAERDFYLKQAIEAVAALTDAEERTLVSAQLATVPRAATVLASLTEIGETVWLGLVGLEPGLVAGRGDHGWLPSAARRIAVAGRPGAVTAENRRARSGRLPCSGDFAR